MNAHLLVDAPAKLGECPLRCERIGSLYWTGIEGVMRKRERHAEDIFVLRPGWTGLPESRFEGAK